MGHPAGRNAGFIVPFDQQNAQAIGKLKDQDARPFQQAFRLDDAGWVANRWWEILPIPMAARQKLMALESASLRLKIVDEYLRGKRVVTD